MEDKKKVDEAMEQTEEIVEETVEEKDETQTEEASVEETSKDPKDQKIQELTDKYQRLMAEFENARKRMTKESIQKYDMGAKDVLEKLLPVVDNFERGLSAVSEEEKDSPFVQGIEAIYKQLMTTLEGIGVTPMNAEGKEFDPNLHNAVMHIEDESLEENVVAEELQKGYMYKETVLRHSMVKVAN
ncbi:MAG: nucleotide exchange factor GrpE [Lachnospiraceae bacterium]|nr:nucleotide exchange factor GrpE [Lachnospiraceae bacterium]